MPCKTPLCHKPVSMRAESAEITYCDDCLLSVIHRNWQPLAPKPSKLSECVGFDGQGCPRGLPRHNRSDSMCASCERVKLSLMPSSPHISEDAIEAECEMWVERGALDHQNRVTVPPYALDRQPAKTTSRGLIATVGSIAAGLLIWYCVRVMPAALGFIR